MDWTDAHPAGLGDPAPLTPLSILPPLGSLGWAGIRFLRTQLRTHKDRSGVFVLMKHLLSLFGLSYLLSTKKLPAVSV